jgi:hypothetical protein
MSGTLIVITGFIYAYVAWEQFLKGNDGLAIAYLGYTLANAGLWMAVK